MDTLAALRAEIAKTKTAPRTTPQKPTQNAGAGASSKRWRTKAEIEKEREQAYLADERAEEEKRRQAKRRKLSQSELSALSFAGDGSAQAGPCSTEQSGCLVKESSPTQQSQKRPRRSDDPPLAKKEVVKRLRALREPVTLFGENAWDRFERLRDIQLAREEGSEGQRNVFQKKLREMQAKDAEDDVYHYAGAKLPHLNPQGPAAHSLRAEEQWESEETTCKEDFVNMHIRKYMRLWQSEISAMSAEDRRTKKGRGLAATHEQTKDWLKPVEKLLRKRSLSRNILDALNDIFQAASRRDYVRANTLYLERLAIGNAPWPMGATMVGIHARAAREKIGEDKIAHVMNDEQTRKYIQAVKRLLTVAQRHFPTTYSKMTL